MQATYKWTVICLMHATNDTTHSAMAMFRDMLSLDIPDDVCITICLRIPVDNVRKIDREYAGPPPAFPDQQTTLFYQVVRKDKAVARTGSKLNMLKEDRVFDITKKEDISDFFQSIVTGKQRADRYMLFTWGHGSAIGVFPFREIQHPRYQLLIMTELKEAILNTFVSAGQKVDIVVMMDCNMQYFDTGLMLHQAKVACMVAAEYGIDFQGYNYIAILSGLYGNTSIPTFDLARLAINTLQQSPTLRPHLNTAAFFATDLSFYDRLIPLINQLGRKLKPDEAKTAITADNYLHTGSDLIDLFQLVDRMVARFGDTWEPELVKEFNAVREHMFIETFKGPGLMRPRPNIPFGMSICVPRSKHSYFYRYFAGSRPTLGSGIADTCGQWTDFIDAYAAASTS